MGETAAEEPQGVGAENPHNRYRGGRGEEKRGQDASGDGQA